MVYDDTPEPTPRNLSPVRPQVLGPVIKIAEGQSEYQTIEGVRARVADYPTPEGSSYNAIVLAFRVGEYELQRLVDAAKGRVVNGHHPEAAIYISLLTFGQPMQAIQVFASREDCAEAHAGMRPLDLQKLTDRIDQALASVGPGAPRGNEVVGIAYTDLLAIRRNGSKLALDSIPLRDFLPEATKPNEMRTPDA